jgi:exonuclease SbcC
VQAAAEAADAGGFASVEEAAAAVRDAAWRSRSEQLLRAHDDECAATTAALAAPELDVALDVPADVEGTAAALASADAALEEATTVAATAMARSAALDELAPALTALLAELGPVLEQARQVRSLADLCTGGGANQLKMTLSSFVLAARLEEVAGAASERLLRMTQGRYSLVHTDGTARGGARSGLGLLARDTWTGQDRETSTLSGGETFLASLALALGLADVVAAEAGGARIEALFVDEGFGTLDEETLDEVMDVLDGLREGGRVVGLVSHVAELRQRIPAQVQVRKGRSGSALTVLGC